MHHIPGTILIRLSLIEFCPGQFEMRLNDFNDNHILYKMINDGTLYKYNGRWGASI